MCHLMYLLHSAAYSAISASVTAQITPDPSQIGARIGMFMYVSVREWVSLALIGYLGRPWLLGSLPDPPYRVVSVYAVVLMHM